MGVFNDIYLENLGFGARNSHQYHISSRIGNLDTTGYAKKINEVRFVL